MHNYASTENIGHEKENYGYMFRISFD